MNLITPHNVFRRFSANHWNQPELISQFYFFLSLSKMYQLFPQMRKKCVKHHLVKSKSTDSQRQEPSGATV
jgi:hypothetical protein